MVLPLYISISSVWASQVFHILTNIWHYSSFKIFINSSEVKSYCGLIWIFLITNDYSYIVFCLLASVTSDENLAIILTIVPLYYHFFFPLAAFKIFLYILDFLAILSWYA